MPQRASAMLGALPRTDTYTPNPEPSSLHPQPSTLNPQASTLSLQPSTLNLQPFTLNRQTPKPGAVFSGLSQAAPGRSSLAQKPSLHAKWARTETAPRANPARQIPTPPERVRQMHQRASAMPGLIQAEPGHAQKPSLHANWARTETVWRANLAR